MTKQELAKNVAVAALEFHKVLEDDDNARFRSWEHCYYQFYHARKNGAVNVDELSLHLAFYLASWGMYRASSFLLQKDYKVHIPAVEMILRPEYDVLFGITCKALLDKDNREKLFKLKDELQKYYMEQRETVKGKGVTEPVSDTLVTKILMGTLGCTPAYDDYFVKAIRKSRNSDGKDKRIKGIASGKFNSGSIEALATFYKDNHKVFDALESEIKVYGLPYPQMKLLDMGFWTLGEKITEEENEQKKAKAAAK